MTWGAVAIGGATLVGGYMAGEASKDAADTSAAAADRSAQLQYDQYLQGRQDLAPYREVAVGRELRSGQDAYDNAMRYWEAEQQSLNNDFYTGKIDYTTWVNAQKTPAPDINDYNVDEVTGYTGGALNTLADYGRSQVAPGDYIPGTSIPTYQGSQIGQMPSIRRDQPTFDPRSSIPQMDVTGDVSRFDYQGDIPKFDVTGDIPEFDSTQFDIYKDPSYEWRKGEMLRGIDRTAGATGKITSGNRMEEIMERTGEMASQEYGAARDRMVQDYGLRRAAETEQYGRDVFGYGEDRQREADLYGRATGEYGLQRGVEQELYGRDIYGYERGYGAEADLYGRGLTEFDIARQQEALRYGRDVDEYGRAYARDVDQYGRDLTGYNALVSQEAGMYGRGVDAYGRAYGEEADYLNRLANLSNIGQAATSQGVTAGTQAGYYGGQAIQAAGQAQAAGTLGQSAAYTGALGDLTSLYTMSQYPQSNYGTAYNYGTNPYSQQTNMLASQWP